MNIGIRRGKLVGALVVAGSLGGFGCDRAPSQLAAKPAVSSAAISRPEPPRAPVATPASSARAAATADAGARFPGAKRVVAIGDVHGDLDAARAALRLAGAIDARDRWVGKDLVVVQTGDQLDRGDQERRILDLFEKLTLDAQAAGGRFLALNGNHEVMNVQGDFRYITDGGFAEFAEFAVASAAPRQVPEAARGRFVAFAPGGVYAKQLAQRPIVATVGDTLFAHGGVLPSHVSYGLTRLNQEVGAWMRGERPALPAVMLGDDAPVWTRLFGDPNLDDSACATLTQVLDTLRVKRLVVGHTVQKSGITSACGERVFRIDVGLARYYGKRPAQILEIQGATVKVVQEKPAEAARADKEPEAVGSP
jgi:hypothetical protein